MASGFAGTALRQLLSLVPVVPHRLRQSRPVSRGLLVRPSVQHHLCPILIHHHPSDLEIEDEFGTETPTPSMACEAVVEEARQQLEPGAYRGAA